MAQQSGLDPNEIGRKALGEPYIGVTTDGKVRDGLYRLEPIGVSTALVAAAVKAWIDTLSLDDRRRALFPIDDPEWRHWSNMHSFRPNGISIREMSHLQRLLVDDILAKALSKQGYRNARDIMRLNHSLAELTLDFEGYGENRYWLTVMGEPSDTQPWGWQIDGHHLIINYFVLGDQVVMSPVFMGSEPTSATSGKYSGTTVLRAEEKAALVFMQGLPETQRQAAIIGAKGRRDNLAEMFKDNVVIPFEGLRAEELSARDRNRILRIAELYVSNMPEGHAAVRMQEIERHLAETYFAWKGDISDDSVFYYRIHSPVLLIEFSHQGPIALPGNREVATRNHVHTVVRTPNGNDYGKALLALHQKA